MPSRSRLPRGALAAIGLAALVIAGIAGHLGFGYPPWVAVATGRAPRTWCRRT
jgi:hypothetical protein